MMEMVDVGIWEYDTKGKLVYGNEAYFNLSGHPRDSKREEMTWQDAVFPEDNEWLTSQWTEMATGNSLTFPMRWKRPTSSMPDGKEDVHGQWVLAACVPTLNEQGQVNSVSGCLTDIAAQKRSEQDALKKAEALERAAASEKRFSNFAEQSNVAIWILNLDHQMEYCNHEWFIVCGHPVVPFDQIDWPSVVSEAHLAVIDQHWEIIVQEKRAVKFQFELKRMWSDGLGGEMRAWVTSNAYPELDEHGNVIKVAGTLTDITHLQWAQRLQRQRTAEAVEAKRQQENFIDMTCHEIRNPLGAVVHCADLVRSSLTDLVDVVEDLASRSAVDYSRVTKICASALEATSIVFSCCAHQKRIVDDILTLSKLDSKLVTIAPAPVRLDDLLTEARRMFEADAQKADVDLRTCKQSTLDLITTQWVTLDAGRLMQVLINLITNGLKFTQKEDERNITLTVGATRQRPTEQELNVEFIPAGIARDPVKPDSQWGEGDDLFLHFSVADTGCGFDDEQKSKIFERFSQASPRTHSKYGGSGLGLFISREMVELQGGAIGVRSNRPCKGATFAFYIAARVVQPPQAEIELAHRAATISPRKKSQCAIKAPSYTLLVVEDNLINQKVFRMQLQKLGHEVHVVNHGAEALEFLEKTSCWINNSSAVINISAILMDIEMPVMNGNECARRIRQLQKEGTITRYLPIVAVSANARDAQVRHAMECGMDDAISKPFRVADLMPKVERLVPL
ncbi:hypothetical protein DOTSEDRAFT_130539 [Dothistroma septosporum NZE10]|uniref:Histidine kinase-like protein n=1 Tax=Dothistroma septosporum (strain NZE10 / CBS 128990) TaxID=675120 RepID=N1PKH1_DOTSN|nr:hypothetical protein DOTSEDRAFT_130539 [Dothistroma septosporum NZE10]